LQDLQDLELFSICEKILLILQILKILSKIQ
jgi:hypothetical protein